MTPLPLPGSASEASATFGCSEGAAVSSAGADVAVGVAVASAALLLSSPESSPHAGRAIASATSASDAQVFLTTVLSSSSGGNGRTRWKRFR